MWPQKIGFVYRERKHTLGAMAFRARFIVELALPPMNTILLHDQPFTISRIRFSCFLLHLMRSSTISLGIYDFLRTRYEGMLSSLWQVSSSQQPNPQLRGSQTKGLGNCWSSLYRGHLNPTPIDYDNPMILAEDASIIGVRTQRQKSRKEKCGGQSTKANRRCWGFDMGICMGLNIRKAERQKFFIV